MKQLRVWVPHLPPSSNKIYIRHPSGKGKVLSSDARNFKIKAMRTIQQEADVAFLNLKHNVPYELEIVLFLEQVEIRKSDKGNRWTKIDLTNRVKLVEDTVAKAIGIDDEHNFKVKLTKNCDPDNPGLYVFLSELPEGQVGITKEEYDRIQLREDQLHGAGTALPKRRLLLRSPWPRKRYSDRTTRG